MNPITVSQLNDYLARIVGTDPLLSNVTVKGEASGVKYHSSGHVYFSIVDEKSRLNCFLHANMAARLSFQLQDGNALILSGGLSIYQKGGSYSLYVRSLEMEGEGALAAAAERMKKRLFQEGLFDPAHKKPLPVFPRKVGVVTASTGAAVRDILKTIRLRNEVVDVMIFPVPVQGEGAGDEIAAMIDYINEHFDDIDVLIVGRGGGSAEDLWAFNEESLARSIYNSRIPVISGVGHEIDNTISDLVADVHAATPTAAAQIAVPDTAELAAALDEYRKTMIQNLQNKVMYQSLIAENLASTLKESVMRKIDNARHDLEEARLILKGNNPEEILKNGYSITEDMDGHVITDAAALKEQDRIRIRFRRGDADAQILTIRREP